MWRYTPAGLVINSSIAIDNGRVIFLESSNSSLRSQVRNRFPLADLLGNGSSSLVALNAATGAEVWRQPTNLSNITTLVYLSCPEGRILLTAVYGGSSNVTYDLYGFSQSNGSQSWKTTIATGSTDLMHGVERGHPVVVNGVAYFVCGPSVYFAVNISTGAQVSWTFNRSGWGCGTACASATHLYVRGDNAVAWNLATSQASRFTTRSRPGCYIDVIPAGGLVNIPETSSGCTCDAYKIQTSMAFRTNLPLEAPTAAQSGRGARKATAPPRVFVLRSPNALIVSAAGIAEGRRVKLSIVNLMGREVFRANGLSQGDAHSHTFVWDNRAAAGGTYVVRLEAGEQHAEQSVTLVR